MAGQDADPWLSVTNATHYALDGLPMRVSHHFRPKPPSKESLPSGLRFNQAQSKALDFVYKYETEEGFIKWQDDTLNEKIQREREKKEKLEAEEERLRLKAEAEKQALKAKAAEEATKEKLKSEQNTHRLSPVPMKPSRPAPTPPVKKAPGNAATNTVSNSILLPERASPTPPSVQPVSALKAENMSLRDFENLAEDPFDTAELKTINDMEVLESVLANSQGVVTDITLDQGTNEGVTKHQDDSQAEEQLYMNPAEVLKQRVPYENISLSKPLSSLVATARNKGPMASPRTSVIENNLNGFSQTASFNPKTETVNIEPKSKPSQASYENHMPAKVKPPVKPKPQVIDSARGDEVSNGDAGHKVPNNGNNVQSLANALSKDLDVTKYRPPGAPKGFSYLPPAPTAETKPVDAGTDLKDIEWPSLDSSKSNPPTPEVMEAAQPRPNKRYDPPPRPVTMPASAQNNLNSKMTNPFLATGNSAKNSAILKQKVPPAKPPPPKLPPPPKITRPQDPAKTSKDEMLGSLLDMGFDRRQIEAAMTHLGSEQQQLVEHLCAVQQLATNGIRWENAQQGILMFTTDLTKAEKFAKSYQQLKEFGFQDGKMKEALINCDMDVDKALEKLLP